MKNTKIYTFSTKNEKDKSLVENLKLEASKSGKSFSFLILEALKLSYDQKNSEKQ